jgi:Leucine-rich repeat (LRR) protein
LVDGKKSVPSQFEANCPKGCYCTKFRFECKDLHETNTDIFNHALPQAYPDLDTLFVTGNNFSELPVENLFTGNEHHQHLSLLNLSNNGIQSFGSQTFIGAARAEYFYLSNNKLNAFFDKQPLKYLTSLKLLDLTSAFDKKNSARRRADLLRDMFESNHDFIDLSEIILASNELQHIHTNTFCKVKGLTRLILKDNLLTSLDFDDGCLESITLLDMRKNRVASVPSTLWKRLQMLNSFDLSMNPLHCACNLQSFHDFALDSPNLFLSQVSNNINQSKFLIIIKTSLTLISFFYSKRRPVSHPSLFEENQFSTWRTTFVADVEASCIGLFCWASVPPFYSYIAGCVKAAAS